MLNLIIIIVLTSGMRYVVTMDIQINVKATVEKHALSRLFEPDCIR